MTLFLMNAAGCIMQRNHVHDGLFQISDWLAMDTSKLLQHGRFYEVL